MKTIRIKIGVNEWTNTHYYESFEIRKRLSEIGDYNRDGTTVTHVEELFPDCENRVPGAENYRYFRVCSEYVDDEENEDIFEEFIAVERGNINV